jgi:hypothetical protein
LVVRDQGTDAQARALIEADLIQTRNPLDADETAREKELVAH